MRRRAFPIFNIDEFIPDAFRLNEDVTMDTRRATSGELRNLAICDSIFARGEAAQIRMSASQIVAMPCSATASTRMTIDPGGARKSRRQSAFSDAASQPDIKLQMRLVIGGQGRPYRWLIQKVAFGHGILGAAD